MLSIAQPDTLATGGIEVPSPNNLFEKTINWYVGALETIAVFFDLHKS